MGLYPEIKSRANRPPISQIISMFKSLTLMADYADQNNVYYDIIIRSRTDVEFLPISYSKVKSIVRKDKLSRYIEFPSISVRTMEGKDNFTPFAEYSLWVTSAKIINSNSIKDYTARLCDVMFFVKEKKKPEKNILVHRSSHNCVPLLLKQHIKTELGAPVKGFKYKLEQMKSNRTNFK